MLSRIATLTCLLFAALAVHAASPLPLSTPAAEAIDPVRLERLHDMVSGYIADGKHAGAMTMVARNGKIVDWQTWGKANIDSGEPLRKDAIFRIYSMTKVITSIAVLQLYEQDKLHLYQPVTDFLPELKDLKVFTGGTADEPELAEPEKPVTILRLLNHTAGFTYGFFKSSPVHELYDRAELSKADSLDDYLARAAQLPLLAHPGEAFHYSISDDLLAVVIERASGMPFEEYIARHISAPLQMHDTAFHVPADQRHRLASIHKRDEDGVLKVVKDDDIGVKAEPGQGVPSGGGGLFSTMSDYVRFVQCLLNGGELDGTRIIGRKTLELAMKNSLPADTHAFVPSQGWGLLSGIILDIPGTAELMSPGTFLWTGAATTHFFADPQEQLIGLVFTQHFPYDEHYLFTRFRTAVYQALE